MNNTNTFTKRMYAVTIVAGVMYAGQTIASVNFNDITLSAGIGGDSIQSPLGNGGMAGGIAWIDYNNDGLQDLFIPNASAGPSRLLKNNGPDTGGNYTFSDVSSTAGVEINGVQSAGAAVGDYDGDGFDDIFVANISGPNTLLRNRGDGSFEDVTLAANLANEVKPSFVASFGDVNGDGYLDIYVGHWDSASASQCSTNDLYINDGNGAFGNEAASVGVDDIGCTFGSALSDYDSDGDLDILSVNDNIYSTNSWRRNKLYRNSGLTAFGSPVLIEQGAEAHFDQVFQGMGIAIGDYNNDGLLDYYRTSLSGGYLSTNTGQGVLSTRAFAAALPPTGDGPINTSAGPGTIGWGTVFFDADNDGFQDLFRVNKEFADPEPNSFYRNDNGVLGEVRLEVGLNTLSGNGTAVADFDNDGDIDVVIHAGSGEISLYENTASGNNWIKIDLTGNGGNPSAVGAKIRLTTPDGNQQLREVEAGSSHGSSNSLVQHFGLGTNTEINAITVEWPSGCTSQINGPITVNQFVNYVAGPCVAGHITDNTTDFGLAGVNLTIWDTNNILATPVTGDTGAFAFDLPGAGWYLEQVTKPGYAVSPSFPGFTADASELIIINHTAAPQYTLTGVVRDAFGDPIEGADIIVHNSAFVEVDTVNSGTDGAYTFAAPAPNWYFVTIAKQGYQFTPWFQGIVVDAASQTRDFTGTAPNTLTGVAQNPNGEGIKGLALTIMDSNAVVVDTVYTDANGNYTFAAATAAWYFVITNKDGYSVLPSFRGIVVDQTHPTLDFVVTPQ